MIITNVFITSAFHTHTLVRRTWTRRAEMSLVIAAAASSRPRSRARVYLRVDPHLPRMFLATLLPRTFLHLYPLPPLLPHTTLRQPPRRFHRSMLETSHVLEHRQHPFHPTGRDNGDDTQICSLPLSFSLSLSHSFTTMHNLYFLIAMRHRRRFFMIEQWRFTDTRGLRVQDTAAVVWANATARTRRSGFHSQCLLCSARNKGLAQTKGSVQALHERVDAATLLLSSWTPIEALFMRGRKECSASRTFARSRVSYIFVL